MQEFADFLDSTDVVDDGEVLRERLARDGYLFIRGLLPRAAVLDVRRRLLDHAARGGWLDPAYPADAAMAAPGAACKDPEPHYMAVFRDLWCDESLHRLRTHPAAIALFERIFGEPVLCHPMFVQRNIFPRTENFDFTTGVHQDKVHIGGASNHALWVPLGDVPLVKGPLAVAAGSHRAGVLETRVGSGAGGMDICVPVPGTWVTGAVRAGDALVFSDVTVHQALPNRSRTLRQSFDARYQPASQPVAETNMVPYSGCGTWAEVYAGWSSSDEQYYWRAFELDVVPLDRSHYERRDRMAFEMAEAGDRAARDALLRIVQRDADAAKRARAERLLAALDAAEAAA